MCAASYSHYKSEDGRVSSATRPSSAGSTQIYTPSTLHRSTASNSPSSYTAIKSGECQWSSWDRSWIRFRLSLPWCLFFIPDSLLFNRIDERLRLARERRGELEKQNGAYLCSFCSMWWLNLLGSWGEVAISQLRKVLAPPCCHGTSVTQ